MSGAVVWLWRWVLYLFAGPYMLLRAPFKSGVRIVRVQDALEEWERFWGLDG